MHIEEDTSFRGDSDWSYKYHISIKGKFWSFGENIIDIQKLNATICRDNSYLYQWVDGSEQ